MDRPTALDADALREAYRDHAGELLGYCLQRVGDRHAAQDAVQETYLRMWRASESYDPQLAGIRTWLYAIARNVLVDQHRRRSSGIGPAASLEGLEEIVDTLASDAAESRLDVLVVEEALRRLSPEHRHVIAEVYLRDRPTVEVATDLDIPAGTVRSRLFHGLRALRAEIDQMGGLR
ncbi:sigma-70 family RNA polymerase sigma factor [Demetria terragena]|uniref:sigma-70 family RNA polymerase sigma factor n=1 Tax=Demetria terragena TaxID=63959 RepID=UPI00035F7B95|nr:sigma-70 family RNA polymerase sigma factor [Demetria terragena]